MNVKRYTRKQDGVILPVLALGVVAIIGVAGLAIDSSHAFVNVTRVQNALDAAALSAATALHNHNLDTGIARNHGGSTFNEHLEGELGSSGCLLYTSPSPRDS